MSRLNSAQRCLRTLSGVALVSGALVAAMAQAEPFESYRYDCQASLPIRDGYSYKYRLSAEVSYDADRLVVADVAGATLSLDLVGPQGRVEATYLKAEPLSVISKGERSIVVDYDDAVYSLNARLSLIEGAENAVAKIYHKYAEDVRVATTDQVRCTATRLP